MPALTGTYRVKLLNGREVDVMPIYQMYLVHLQDYDLDTSHQITRAPKDLMVRWARDSGTIKPAAMHNGEGVCHYFHMTEMGRAAALVHDLDGQHRQVRHRAAIPGPATTRPAFGTRRPGPARAWRCIPARIRSIMTLDPNAHGKEIKTKSYYYGEEVGYWNHGDTALIVNTPKYGRKVFTGQDPHAEPEQGPVGDEREHSQQRQAPL